MMYENVTLDSCSMDYIAANGKVFLMMQFQF
jgi:hypothetical protein